MPLLLIRHAQSQHNIERSRVAGRKLDSPLTAIGVLQSTEKGKQLAAAGDSINSIYHSGAVRSRLTAELIAKELPGKQELVLDRRLLEMDVGNYVGKPKLRVALNPAHIFNLLSKRFDFRFDGGESFNDVANRMDRACKEIASKHTDDTAVAVTHGLAIRCLLAKRQNWSVLKLLMRSISNTESVELG